MLPSAQLLCPHLARMLAQLNSTCAPPDYPPACLPACLPACRGFKLLSAMGYQQGRGIGKSGTGLAEPLPLLLKQARGARCVRRA
jgi:hypothetical protein